MLKSKIHRLFVMLAAMCCFLFARSAMADAPQGGYRVVRTTKDAVVLEVGVGLSIRTLAQDFGAQFKTSTGVDLTTLDGLQKFQALNPRTTIPVCATLGDGPIFKGAEHLEVWQSCPVLQQTLWLIAHRTVEIPLVRVEVETFAEKWARLQRADACTDVVCVVGQLKNPQALASLQAALRRNVLNLSHASVVSPPASAPAPASVQPSAQGGQVSPQAIKQPSFLGWHLFYLVFTAILIAALFKFALKFVSAEGKLATLEARFARKQEELKAAGRTQNASNERAKEFRDLMRVYFERLAEMLGATLEESMTHLDMFYALVKAHNLREEARQREAEAERQELEAAKRRYAELRSAVDSGREQLFKLDESSRGLEKELRAAQTVLAEGTVVGERGVQQRVQDLQDQLDTLALQSAAVFTEMTPALAELNELAVRFTGCHEPTQAHYAHALQARQDAAALEVAAACKAVGVEQQLEYVKAREAAIEDRTPLLEEQKAAVEAHADRLAKIGEGREKELARTRDALDRAEKALADVSAANAEYRETLDRLAEENAGMDQRLVRAEHERDAFLAALFPDTADGQHPALSQASSSGSFDRVAPGDASQVRFRSDAQSLERASSPPKQAADFLNWASGFAADLDGKAIRLTSIADVRNALELARTPIVLDRKMLDASLGADGVHTDPGMQRLLARATLSSLPYLAERMSLLAPQPAQASA